MKECSPGDTVAIGFDSSFGNISEESFALRNACSAFSPSNKMFRATNGVLLRQDIPTLRLRKLCMQAICTVISSMQLDVSATEKRGTLSKQVLLMTVIPIRSDDESAPVGLPALVVSSLDTAIAKLIGM